MQEAKSLDGILSYLTKKHGGHVHERGLVAVTSKSFWQDRPLFLAKNAADFTCPAWYFCSKDEPGQWISWDFGEMRVRPTHYTMMAHYPKSWVVEGSLDGTNWTEIDRQTDNADFEKYQETASFRISKPVECRFIRLSQTGKNHQGKDYLGDLLVVEFFGTLSAVGGLPPSPREANNPQPAQSATESPLCKVGIPMQEAKSRDGILSYLTKKHGGHVHERGLVAVTSKSFAADAARYLAKNAADLTCDESYFISKDEPGQWISWDFREMRIRPTHYTMMAQDPKSWVVEGSLDGTNWSEIDRRTDNKHFEKGKKTGSFPISKPVECRFIRLSQTAKNHDGTDCLGYLYAVEFFGALSE
jgi:hypothetical protein